MRISSHDKTHVETTVPPKPDPGALSASHILLWIFLVLNIGVGVLMVLALPASFDFRRWLDNFFVDDNLATVRAGDPFVPDNAARLMTIAWCALVIEVLRLLFGLFASTINAAGSNIDFNYSLTGWLAVALTFVLARVFEHGTRMRDDLETMI